MTRRWALAGALLGACAGALVAAPAAWVTPRLESASAQRLRLLDPAGTIWNGRARLVLSAGSGDLAAVALPGHVTWQLLPGWGSVHLTLHATCCTPTPLQVVWTPSWTGWQLRVTDAQSRWPAALLAGLGAPWNTMQLTGLLVVRSESLSLQMQDQVFGVGGAVDLDALDMASQLSTLRPMGSYRMRVQGGAGPGAPSLALQTLEGGLQLSGNGQWSGSRWRFAGEASAAPESEEVLGNLLNIIGRRRGAKSLINLG